MTYPSVQFVESPDAGAVVRLDLNATGASVDVSPGHDGFSLGMGALSGTAGGRGRSWGPRQLSIPLLVDGTRAAALGVLGQLARECARDGWLRWQLDATTSPVWFRVYATAPDPLDFELIYKDLATDLWTAKLTVDADPFGVGARRVLWSGTVTNTPVGGAWEISLPTVAGEMPAPAEVKVTRTSWILGLALSRSGLPSSLTAGSGWSASVAGTADAAYLSGSRRETAAAAYTAWADVCQFAPTGAAGAKQSIVRISGSSNAGAFALRWKISGGGTTLLTAPVVVPVATMLRWVTLGRVPFPLAAPSSLGGSLATVYTLQAKRVAAGGNLRFDDRLVLTDAGDPSTLLRMSPADVGAVATTILADSAERQPSMLAGGVVARAPEFAGGWPQLRPGETNQLLIAQNLDPRVVASRDDSITATATVEVAYRPRYLWGV